MYKSVCMVILTHSIVICSWFDCVTDYGPSRPEPESKCVKTDILMISYEQYDLTEKRQMQGDK